MSREGAHESAHDHGHDHAPPDAVPHGHATDAYGHDHPGIGETSGSTRRLGLALAVVVVVMAVEIVGGIVSGSLALLADAAHMGTDAFALGLALVASSLRGKGGGPQHSYGLRRAPVLSAFINGLLLLALAAWVVFEAVQRFVQPPPVLAGTMLAVAVVGLLANILSFWLLHGGDRHDLNLRGALLHVLGDMLGSVAAIVAALVMLTTGWMLADPLLSIVVALLVAFAATNLLREAGRILLEAAPPGVDLDLLATELPRHVPGLVDVHHLHVWSLAPHETLLTCHARVDQAANADVVRAALRAELTSRYGIGHATIETERVDCGVPGGPC